MHVFISPFRQETILWLLTPVSFSVSAPPSRPERRRSSALALTLVLEVEVLGRY